MIALAGGTFRMGSDRHYPEEAPTRAATVGPFEIDPVPVTNAEFAAFVTATGYVTVAERAPSPDDLPGMEPALLVPGSAVFTPPPVGTPARRATDWWRYVPGACWRVPQSNGQAARPTHPVVHVALEDARAYAAWCGKSLPTEAEWEFAAWGGSDTAEYAWGSEFMPGGRAQANTWHGHFPFDRSGEWARTSPVGSFPPNSFGLFDMIGNVWEWTETAWAPKVRNRACCSVVRGGKPLHAVKGGSHLCATNYCRRYRPAARQPHVVDNTASHLGFRCVRRKR